MEPPHGGPPWRWSPCALDSLHLHPGGSCAAAEAEAVKRLSADEAKAEEKDEAEEEDEDKHRIA